MNATLQILKDIFKRECVSMSEHTRALNQSYEDGYRRAIDDVIELMHKGDKQEGESIIDRGVDNG